MSTTLDPSMYPPGFETWTRYEWSWFCRHNPRDVACDNVPSYFGYRIDLAANVAFCTLFSLSALLYILTYAITRRGLSFFVAMFLGVLCEILGYAGRIMAWKNQWVDTGFLMQICCLTIGPAFLAAGIYLSLRKIVYAFGAENSRIKPEWYTRIFIPCDLVSLVLQAIGGAMASILSTQGKNTKPGDNIMIAGLVSQVVTMFIFMILASDFAWRTWSRHRRLGDAAFDQTPALAQVRASKIFRAFLGALALAFICIFWRCVYRIAELSEGWTGPLMKRQNLFIGFEGVMIVIAALVLNVFHPAIACKAIIEQDAGGLNIAFWRKKKPVAEGEGAASGDVAAPRGPNEKSDGSASDA